MTSRERMTAALEGRPVDRLPVAPYFWGAEYSWKLVGRPLWDVLHGEGDVATDIITALDERHGPDWIIQTYGSSRALVGKTYTGEDDTFVRFTDDTSGEEYVFHKEGHWISRAADAGKERSGGTSRTDDPPANKAEADEWLRRRFPHVFEEPKPHVPNRELRDRFPDRFLCGGVTPPFAAVAYSLGFEPALMLLHDDPSLFSYLIERVLCHVPRHLEKVAANGCDGVMMVDSWASADIMSPETYANWVAPHHKLIADEARRVGLKSIMYNTGNLLPLMSCIAGLGFDAISPEERIKGVEMDIGEIRQMVGPDVCLFGNFDSYLLLNGDREAIRAEVRRQIESAGPRSFVMGSGSPICDATDPDVLDFWFDLVREERWVA